MGSRAFLCAAMTIALVAGQVPALVVRAVAPHSPIAKQLAPQAAAATFCSATVVETGSNSLLARTRGTAFDSIQVTSVDVKIQRFTPGTSTTAGTWTDVNAYTAATADDGAFNSTGEPFTQVTGNLDIPTNARWRTVVRVNGQDATCTGEAEAFWNNPTWASKSSMPTSRGAAGVAAAANGKIYVAGGRNLDIEFTNVLNTLEEYDPGTDTWTAKASMATARWGLALVAAANGKLYAIGGSTAASATPTSVVEEYDPTTNTWTPKAAMPTARLLFGAAGAANGKIYAIGGQGGSFGLNVVEEYDPVGNTWATKTAMPTGRRELGVARGSDGLIYAIGGRSSDSVPLAVNEAYDPGANSWTSLASMPATRFSLAAVGANNGRIYAIGGSPALGTVERYDPFMNTWSRQGNIRVPRSDLGVVNATNGKLYALGGFAGSDTNVTEEATILRAPLSRVAQCGDVEAPPLLGATVELRSGSTLLATQVSGSEGGEFLFPDVAPAKYSLRYLQASEGEPIVCGESVFFDGTTSRGLGPTQCVTLFEPGKGRNRSWPNAFTLTPGAAPVREALCSLGQPAWFKVHIKPGSRLVALLTGPSGGRLPANYDLLMFKDIQAAFDEAKAALSGTPKRQDITAQFAGDSFGGDSFGGDSFGGDSFGGDSFGGDSFGGDSFGGDSFGGDSFGGDSFGGDSFGGDSFGGDSFGGDSFGGDSFGGDSFGGDSFGGDSFGGLSPRVLAAVVSRSVIGVSAHEGTSRELLWHNTWTNTGDFYLRVRGRHGAFAPDTPFEISVQLFDGACKTVTPAVVTSSLTAAAGGYTSLILTNTARFTQPNGQPIPPADVTTLTTALQTLSADTNPAGSSANLAAVDLAADTNLAAAYGVWDQHKDCPFAANMVTDGIKDFVKKFIAANPGTVTQIIFVGSDRVIPLRRVPDLASIAKESMYVPPVFDSSVTQASLRFGYFMTQDFYTSFHPISKLDHELYLPELPTGRLVETVAEISTMVNAYHAATAFANGGRGIAPNRAIVTGYNFFSDSARDIRSQLLATNKLINTNASGTPLAGNPLIQADSTVNGVTTIGGLPTDPGAWNSADLRRAIATNPQLFALNAHITRPDQIVAANGSSLLTSDILAMAAATPNLLRNSLIWTASCHSSFNIPDSDAIPGITPGPEAAQAFARLGTTAVGGTGYQYGETEIIDYTERILVNFVTELRRGSGAVKVGDALVRAKSAYAASVSDFKGIHEKALLESTVFGVPSFSVDLGTAGRLPASADNAPFGTGALTAISSTGQKDLRAVNVTISTSLGRNDVTLRNASGTGTTTTSYFALNSANVSVNGGAPTPLAAGLQANPAQPILPLTTLPLHLTDSDTVLPAGAVFLRADFADVAAVTPLTASPGEQLANPHPQFFSEVFAPQRFFGINYLSGEHLAYTPSQFQSGIGTDGQRLPNGSDRNYTSATFRLFYSGDLGTAVTVNTEGIPVALVDAPAIIGVVATRDTTTPANISFEVIASALPGLEIRELYVTFTKKLSLTAGAGSWESLALAQDTGSPAHWSGTLSSTEDIVFFVQAVGGAGRVRVSTNFGAYYGITVPPTTSAPKHSTSLQLQNPPSTAISRHPITVSAKLTDDDRNGAVLVGKRILFTLNAERAVGYTNSSGIATVQFAVSATPRDVQPPRPYNLTAAFEEDSGFLGSMDSSLIAVQKDNATLTLSVIPPINILNGVSRLDATLSDSLGRRLREQTIFFLVIDNAGTVRQVVSAETDFIGKASANLKLSLPLGVYRIKASFADTFTFNGVTINSTNTRFNPASATKHLVAFNPFGSFVAGVGEFNSPAGALRTNPSKAGEGEFAFIAQQGSPPVGAALFRLEEAGFTFIGLSLDTLTVIGPNIRITGSGKVNDSGDYAFEINALDGQVTGGGGTDKFRIKITNKANGAVVYDTLLPGGAGDGMLPLAEGVILIVNR